MNKQQNTNQLPKDWKWVKLGQVGKIETGTTPSKGNSEYYGNDIPFFKPTDLQQGINTITASDNLSKLGFEKTRKLPKNSILVTCIGATIGKTGLIKVEGASNQQINSIIPDKLHDSKFVFYQIISQSFQKQIKDNASSTTLPILNKSKFQQLDFITADADTQLAIVSKIEELFSELDKGIETLRLAKHQLKTYRQSVLKWAFEGRLTNENVKEGELPEGWQLVRLEKIATKITDGEHITPRRTSVGVLLLSARNIQNGFLKLDHVDYIPEDEYERIIKRCNPEYGDILISCSGSVGRVSRVPKDLRFTMVRSVALVKLNSKFHSSKYFEYLLQSPFLQKQIEKGKKATAQANLFLGPIKDLNVIQCPIEEQNTTVQEIESRLSVADKMEECISQSLQQAEALRQSILKKAFEGKLI